MKRSEIINLISNDISPWMVNPDKSVGLAEWVLRSIENAGMMPPFNKELYYNKWREGESGYEWDSEIPELDPKVFFEDDDNK